MALETGTYISSLNASNPASTDGLAQADDHIRLLKSTIKATLPNVTGAITSTHTELNALTGVTASATEINKLDGLTASTEQLNTLATAGGVVPTGGIIMWSGAVSAIPTGWVLCNGSNSTPDLRDRFVVGAGSTYAVNATGGSATVVLTDAQMPNHHHYFDDNGTTASAGNHRHGDVAKPHPSDNGRDGDANSDVTGLQESNKLGNNTGYAGSHNHSFSVTGYTDYRGSDEAHENRPPYYALAYIMKS